MVCAKLNQAEVRRHAILHEPTPYGEWVTIQPNLSTLLIWSVKNLFGSQGPEFCGGSSLPLLRTSFISSSHLILQPSIQQPSKISSGFHPPLAMHPTRMTSVSSSSLMRKREEKVATRREFLGPRRAQGEECHYIQTTQTTTEIIIHNGLLAVILQRWTTTKNKEQCCKTPGQL